MTTYIKELTKSQRDAMPGYAQRWIEIGLRTGETDFNTFDKYMPICFQKAGIEYPPRVVRVKSPLVGALAAAVAEGIWQKRRDAVRGAVADAVGGAVDDAVADAVRGAVRGAVRDAVRGAVGGAVDDAVADAVRGAVDDAVADAVRDAVRGAVGGAVGGAVRGAVRDAVGGAVRGAVRDAVADAVGGAVDDAVRGAVRGAVRDAVRGAVDDAVDDAVRGAVDDAGGGAVKITISIAKKACVSLAWHYWLGGQFWVGGWYWGCAFVNFFFDICKLELSADIMERAKAYRKVCESVNYIWPNRDFVIVCERPKRINQNTRGQLHSMTEMAIEYSDGWGLYFIDGIRFDYELWYAISTGSLCPEAVFSIKNIEQRRVAYEKMDKAKMAELPGLAVLDKGADKYGNPQRIVSFNVAGFRTPFLYLHCVCPSTGREYYLETKQRTCAAAKAASFGLKDAIFTEEW